MKTESEVEILHRLRSAEGHLRAALEMSEAGKSCEQILQQLNAVQAALRAISLTLIRCQIEESKSVIIGNVSTEQRAAEMKRVQSLFRLFTKQANRAVEVTHE